MVKKNSECCGGECKCSDKGCPAGGGCFFYGLAFLGSAVYYVSISTGFWGGVLGVLKAVIWPAFLVFGLSKFLGL